MKFNKSIALLFPLCATMLLASCGGDKPNTDNKPDNPDIVDPTPNPDIPDKPDENKGFIKKPTTIVFKSSTGQDKRPILEGFVESFKKIEPNVTVVLEYPGGGYAGVANSTISDFQTGLYGDLVIAYPDSIADFIDYGFGYKLDKYIEHPEYGLGADYSDYIPAYLQEGKKYAKNGTFSMPFSKSTECMFYDYDKLIGKVFPGVNNDQAITVDYMNSLTWEKLFTEFCPGMVEYSNTHEGFIDKSNTEKGWGILGWDSDANLFITLAEQYGFPYTSIDKVTGKGSFDFYKKDGSTDNYMLAKMKEFADARKKNYIFTNNAIGTRPNDLFVKSQCLLSVGSTAGVKYQFDATNAKKVMVCNIPQAEGKAPKVISQGPSMAFLRHQTPDGKWDEDRMLASWLFYKHMTTLGNCTQWSLNANYMPIRQKVYSTPSYDKVSHPEKVKDQKSLLALTARVNAFVPSLSEMYYTSPAFKGSRVCRDSVDKLVGDIFKLENPTTEAIKALFEETLNNILLSK